MATRTKTVPLANLARQVATIQGEVEERFRELFATATFILRQPVEDFERDFAAFIGVRHATGVGNGTDAVTIALKALDVRPGDEVITAANSFIATAEAIVLAGATPVLVDADPDTFNLDPELVGRAVTARTRVVVPVHFYGRPAPMDAILAIAREHGLHVVEDAAQAHGARYGDRRVGGIGDLGCFSFYPTKNIGAFGDGGAVVTDDDELAHRVRVLHDHGGVEADQHEILAQNSRLDSLQAAVLSVQLPRLDGWNEARRAHADAYRERLTAIGGGTAVLPPATAGTDHVHHLYVTRVPGGRRDRLLQELRSRGVGAGIHYPRPIHLTPAFSFLGRGPGSFPVAEQLAREILSLPMFPQLEPDELSFVCDQLEQAVAAA